MMRERFPGCNNIRLYGSINASKVEVRGAREEREEWDL